MRLPGLIMARWCSVKICNPLVTLASYFSVAQFSKMSRQLEMCADLARTNFQFIYFVKNYTSQFFCFVFFLLIFFLIESTYQTWILYQLRPSQLFLLCSINTHVKWVTFMFRVPDCLCYGPLQQFEKFQIGEILIPIAARIKSWILEWRASSNAISISTFTHYEYFIEKPPQPSYPTIFNSYISRWMNGWRWDFGWSFYQGIPLDTSCWRSTLFMHFVSS